ncbi:MAG: glycosyltransferase, partial [Candidatus Muirbacterium halophilum]|nr:glycosyltransferase [Candidatus Muirbacterium halophilum]
ETTKKPELFLELAKKLPHKKFVMIMPGSSLYKDKIVNEIKLIKNMQFYDFIDYKKIDIFFKKAECFINTSEFEGFPNTFIQSFMNYTPILSFNVNPDNIINKYNLGFFSNNNIEKSIEFLKILNNKKINFLGQNCYNYVSKQHNIKIIGIKYANLIKEMF